ncbi:hypothetical protein FSP39_021001 [Pinctada imbricata]|uniref:CHHC U11-48K-type domain-containing protein n=1 Tax=Pinctada imbricata TaxID=66713 RepID=A0AA89BMC8_PINIB|nr:hypothetical protein FSP39_021001 [Pinctada imbricata]
MGGRKGDGRREKGGGRGGKGRVKRRGKEEGSSESMAQYNIPDPEDLIPCPYDKVHMVRAKRMQYHLMKCRKNYVGREYATCPFNARHEMPKPELRYHIVNCPDKAMIEPNMAYEKAKRDGEGTMFKGCTDVPVYDNFVPQCEENWDEEIPIVPRIGVDPAFFAKIDQRVLTTGLSKAKKRDYNRQMFLPPEERKFISEIEQKGPEEEEPEEGEGQLRLPKTAPQVYIPAKPKSTQQPSIVFAHAVSMAGVGRGIPGATNLNPPNGMNGVSQHPMAAVGRGRGIGRGAPPGFNIAPPGGMVNSTTPYVPEASCAPAPPQNVMPSANTNGLFTMGTGRGRGNLMQTTANNPQFVIPNANVITPINQQNGFNNIDSGTAARSAVQEEKKLRKKIRQIEMLEEKSKEGYKLSEEEEFKVAKKDDLLQALEALTI